MADHGNEIYGWTLSRDEQSTRIHPDSHKIKILTGSKGYLRYKTITSQNF